MNQSHTCSKCRHFVIHDHHSHHCAITNLPVDFVDSCDLFEHPDADEKPKQKSGTNVKKAVSITFILYIVFKLIKFSGVFDSKPATQVIDTSDIYRNMMVEIKNDQAPFGKNNKNISRSYFTKDKDFSKAYFQRQMKLDYHHLNDSLKKYDTLYVEHHLYYGDNMDDTELTHLFNAKGKVTIYQQIAFFQLLE